MCVVCVKSSENLVIVYWYILHQNTSMIFVIRHVYSLHTGVLLSIEGHCILTYFIRSYEEGIFNIPGDQQLVDFNRTS